MEFKNTTENNDNRVNIIDQSPQRVPQEMKLNNNNRKFELIVIFTSLIIFLAFLAILDKGKVAEKIFNKETVNLEGLKVKKFSSEAEFKEYLSKSTSSSNYFGSFSAQRNIGLPLSEGFGESVVPGGTLKTDMPAVPERVSETNVQVYGIDEPDIVKTDGVNIYFSNTFGRTYPLNVIDMGISQEEDGMFTHPLYNTKVIKAFPPEEIKTLSNISENGEMLLFDDVLVTLSGNKFSGYDIRDPGNPDRKWVQELEGNTQIEAARKFENKLYLIAQTYVYNTSPCPIPLIKNGMSITCTDIYYPPIGNSTDTTYTILIVNPDDGSIDNEE